MVGNKILSVMVFISLKHQKIIGDKHGLYGIKNK